MKIYLSGPMSGIPNGNRPLFHSETRRLRNIGYYIVNPAENDDESATRSHADCLRTDIRQLLDCDMIAMLPGWQKSKGANIERAVAVALNMSICDASELY